MRRNTVKTNTVNTYESSLVARSRAVEAYKAIVESKGTDIDALVRIQHSVPPGLYEHWKSEKGNPKFYVVYGAGVEQDVHTPLVSYAALYPPHAGRLTYRNLIDEERGFLMPIDREVYKGPRFERVCRLTLGEITTLLQYVGELSVIKDPVRVRVHVARLLKSDKVPIF
jgi:hypothetical protein